MNKIMMPPGGQTTDESLIIKWHKKVGDKIQRGDVLVDIETDKAILEIESYCEGYLRAAMFEEGEKASNGDVIAYVGAQDEQLQLEESVASQKQTAEEAEDEYQPIMKTETKQPVEALKITPVLESQSGKMLSSPLAKRLARDNNLKISDIPVPESGVIKKKNVLEYLRKSNVKEAEDFYFIPTSTMRKVIARRMCESVYTAPHYTVSMDIDMTACIKIRKTLNYYAGESVKISFNDIIAKCVAKAIKKYPLINSAYAEDQIKIFNNVNVGLAVGINGGLVVPVVKNVNSKSLSEIAVENNENVRKAKEGRLTSQEMSGGTITISNLGMYGVDNFTAVINQPESCILAVGGIKEKAVSINGEIVSKDMMNITASFDHRVIDGAVGAEFLKEVKIILEKPELLLI